MHAAATPTAHRDGMTPELPDGYEHGTTRGYARCRPACKGCRAANAAAAAARRTAKLAVGMPDNAHGKPSGYTFWSCRCKRCKKAWRDSREGSKRKPTSAPDIAMMPATEHGTNRGYNYWGCRCEPCRSVAATARAEAKARRRAEPDPGVEVVVRRYEYRIDPEPSAILALRQIFGSCRYVYNSYIALARGRYASGDRHPSAYDATSILVTQARRAPETAWLTETAHAVLAAAVHDAADAYRRFFDSGRGEHRGAKIGYPKFKNRHNARRAARFPEGSFTIRGGWQNTGKGGGRLHLAAIAADVRVNWHRPLPGYPSAVTIREDPDGRFWASFIVRVPVRPSNEPTHHGRIAALDLGIKDYASIAYSDGSRERIDNLRPYPTAEQRLKRTDKNLARKTPGSSNYEKARVARARAHAQVANTRENHSRQLATRLARENETVVVETLGVADMASSKRAGTQRSKNIYDAGWAQFVRHLEEACVRFGTEFVKAPRFLASTQICSICGCNGGKKDTDIRSWTCAACDTDLDRDYNAAVNIMTAAGPAVDACGRDVRLRLAGADPDEAGSRPKET